MSVTVALGGQPRPIPALQATIRQRTGHDIEWRADSATEQSAASAVHALLRRPLTADTAVAIALLNNRELQATFEQIGIADADMIEAGLLKNPVFEGSPRFPDSPPSAADVELSIAQDFLDLIMLPLRKKIARQKLARTQLLVGDAVLKLAADTKTAFYQLQAAEQLLAAAKTYDEASAAAAQVAVRQQQAGTISDMDLANQQAASSQSQLDIMGAEIEVQADREKLDRLMSLAEDHWTASDQLPPLPPEDPLAQKLEALALSQRLDLAATEAEWAGIVQALGISRTYRYIGVVELGVDTENQTDNQRITGPTLRLELPIFNHGQGRIARLQAQLRQVERTLEAQAIDIRSETREASERTAAERRIVLFYRDQALPERKRVLDLTTTQYNSMLKGDYDLLIAEQNELTAQRGYIGALRDYWIARADLERATGGLNRLTVKTPAGDLSK
jgi:cobalt-zinc-cadmium efflux system outer membrane protein